MSSSDENLMVSFVKRSAFFGTLLVGVKVLNFAFLFLWWHLLEPAHFGIIAVAQGLSLVLAPGLNLGLSNSMARLYKSYSERGRGKDLIGSTFVVAAGGAGMICLALTLLGNHLLPRFFPGVPFQPYLLVALWSGFFLSLCNFGEQVVRVTDRLRLNSAYVVGEFVLKNGFILGLVLVQADPAMGYLLGEMSALGIISFGFAVIALRGSRIRLSREFLGEPLRLALPIIPASILGQLNNTLDRFVLVNYVTKAELGLYAQAMRVGSILDILTRALKTVWFPTLLRSEPGTEGNLKLQRKAYIFTFDFFAFLVLGLSVAGIPVIRLVAPPAYHPMCVFLPAVGMVLLAKNFIFLPALRLLTTRFAVASLISVAATTGAAALLHGVFTVRFGIVGALVAMGGTHLFSYFVMEGLARKVYPVRLPWAALTVRLFLLAALAAGATWLAALDPSSIVFAVQTGATLLLAVPFAVYFTRRRKGLLGQESGVENPPRD
ncbi:MAG: lipopolysaccharide biosynthesis protein [Planctomycetota bacterium]